MAGLMGAGFLPTIKCSNCGLRVEISEMGDHICKPSPAPPSPSPSPPPPPPPKSDHEPQPQGSMPTYLRNISGPRRPGPPPRIDPSLANRPFIHTDGRLSRKGKDSLTPPPLSVPNGQRSPFHAPQQIRIPLLDGPDSPEVIKPVGDLPAFPLPRSMSRKRLDALAQLQSAQTAQSVPSSEFASAMAKAADRHSQSTRSSSSGTNSITKVGDLPLTTTIHHRRGDSIDSRSSYGTSAGSSRYGDNSSKRSTAMSSRRPSLGSIAQDHHHFPEESSSLHVTTLEPLMEHSSASEQQAGVDSQQHEPKSAGFGGFDLGVSAPTAAATTTTTTTTTPTTQTETEKPYPDPLRVSSHTQSDRLSSTRGSVELFFRSPSQSSFGLPADWLDPTDARSSSSSSTNIEYKAFRPSGSNYLQPAVQPSDSKDVPSRSATGSSESNTSVSKFARALGLDLPGHAADNSTSSSDSSPSETRSGTSLSSLPSEASLSRRKMSETVGLRGVVQDLPDKANQQTVLPASNQTESPVDLEPPRISEALFSPDSPTDPAINQGSLSLVVERTAKPLQDAPPVRPTIARSATEPPVRPPPRSKGRCRGCGETIIGKSVSSKDGRLTGRYHRDCFVCCHCRSPFETADFYVLNDRPYCAQHYHELNGSLCSGCNKGIEGQYLETDERTGRGPGDCQKFHPECLTCRTCRIPLKGEYFEWNGRVYCERDARRAAASMSPHRPQRPTMPSSPLASHPPNYPPMPSGYPRSPGPGFGPGPGPRRPPGTLDVPRGPPPSARRFPERRTTRLMMI
ncbi:LIM domain-containing protein [Aspergillus clavatus NRRL 1]|uniref:LIM domain protein n=1 Tax=Aspergillus clavatus (strain ATCC 1007 / CBS 513.65 / DSM 816 / NCTC 3887 / NRRL 1 / QM 1276 / 107) TaxID=344612 RepID=A1CFT4_ASPCL|nr:LIM domain protein [Aspergillus clavatus NRRL 1]EAW11733.1 LIM domain protein [Aspergillus clavatus NRRL 1]